MPRFSIHKRIEGGATIFDPRLDFRPSWFQYPQADRRGCNAGGLVGWLAIAGVSVSTSGSKGVQQVLLILMLIKLFCFSIHKRIEGGATRT